MSEASWVSELVKAVQQSRLAFAGAVACGVCLALGSYAPTEAAALVSARPYLIFGLCASVAVLVWDLSKVIGGFAKRHLARSRVIDETAGLTKAEKRQLALWIELDVRSGNLDMGGVAASLAHRGLMVQVADRNPHHGTATYVIPNDVWDYLKKHPELLSGEE